MSERNRDDSLGLIETVGLVGAIEACDAAAKTAAVIVSSAEITDSALVTLRIYGELGAVQAAVEAGARAAARVGQLLAAHVIPNPDRGLDVIMPAIDQSKLPKRPQIPRFVERDLMTGEFETPLDFNKLESMPVAKLRRYARTIPNLAIKGRQISRADKHTLLREIRKARGDFGAEGGNSGGSAS